MISTIPSNRIEDFIEFYRRAENGHAADCRLGASEAEIEQFAALCRYPLPAFYVSYLKEFGRNDAELMVGGDADNEIEALIEFYKEQARSGYQLVPSQAIVMGVGALDSGRVLVYTTDVSAEPSIATFWDGEIGAIKAQTFRNYLYKQAFIRGRFPPGSISNVNLSKPRTDSIGPVVSLATSLGFAPYWFCDEYHACLERDEQFLLVELSDDFSTRSWSVCTRVFAMCTQRRAASELRYLFANHLDFSDNSPD